MIDAIPLSALPPPLDPTRRDGRGRYLIVPPEGGKPVGYQRVTRTASLLDDSWGIPPWMAAMATIGTLMRRGLRAQWEALLARSNGNPWYYSEETKRECKRLVDEAAAVGGANDRSELGTALHEITSLLDHGRELSHLSEDTAADVRAYQAALAEAGISFLPDMIERIVVLDRLRIAGTFDRGAIVPGFERPMIADLKTGADLSYAWQAIASQLSLYSRGEALYTQGAAEDGSEDVREEPPDWDQENGLVIWLPAGTGTCQLFLVDLTAGWASVDHALWVQDWRNRKVAMDYEPGQLDRWSAPTTDDDLETVLEASLAVIEAQAAAVRADQIDVDPIEAEAEPLDFRGWLQERIDAIGQHPQARQDLATSWPEGVPSLRTSTAHTVPQLDQIEHVLDTVERLHRLAFPSPRPTEAEGLDLIFKLFPQADDVGTDQGEHPA
jgi:hypothetical protein